MDKKDEFELDFDFEKEYGFSAEDLANDAPVNQEDDFNFDLGEEDLDILKFEKPAEAEPEFSLDDFGSAEDYKLLEDYGSDDVADFDPDILKEFDLPAESVDFDEPTVVFSGNADAPEGEAQTYDEFDDLSKVMPPVAAQPAEPVNQAPVAPVPPAAPVQPRRERKARQNPLKKAAKAQESAPVAETNSTNPRRKKRSQMRIIKEDYLPYGIAGAALLLCLIFIVGSVIRTVHNNRVQQENQIAASEQAASEALRLEEEAQRIREEAAVYAAGYDYQAAIDTIDSFSGDVVLFPELLYDRSQYTQSLGQMVEVSDFRNVPNLSFHVLIADPATAFNSEPYGNKYQQNFVTIDEFSKILDQLYENGYVLVNFDDFIEEIPDGTGKVTFQTKSIQLPSGKKPIMITETLVNYFPYMIDGDDDGIPDKDGDGFASKLVVRDGEITCERVNSAGETVYGAYDLVPILNQFIDEHPDFSYRGAKATLAVTGSEGIFGYRIEKGDADEIAACKELVQALRDDGYLLACNSFSNVSYHTINATGIQEDLEKWDKYIAPVIGDVDILVYALGSDISDYNGSKYNVMANAGFKYFLSTTSNSIPATEVNVSFVRQYRIMVTGSLMVNSPNTLAPYFTVSQVMNTNR